MFIMSMLIIEVICRWLDICDSGVKILRILGTIYLELLKTVAFGFKYNIKDTLQKWIVETLLLPKIYVYSYILGGIEVLRLLGSVYLTLPIAVTLYLKYHTRITIQQTL